MENEYDKVYLSPKRISTIPSRDDVDLRSKLYGLYPIISSPMRGISGSKLVAEMARNNCLGIIHRFETIENRLEMINEVAKQNVPFGVAIGFGKDLEEFKNVEIAIAEKAAKMGAILLIVDSANGYLPQWVNLGKILRDKFPDLALGAGNVITEIGAQYLRQCGFNYVRVGIGNGNLCETRHVTGVGRNQLKALKDCSMVDVEIISDGGINEPGKAVKSFACGADYIFLGSLLGQALESEHDGIIFGMASHRNMMLTGKTVKSIEGRDMIIEKKKPLKDILIEFLWGIRSACTYLNAKHYIDLRDTTDIIGVNE
jgi:GMP reductase